MAESKNRTFRGGLAFKMILYIFASILLIFIVIFHFTQKTTRAIVSGNLKTSAKYLTTSTVERIEKVVGSIQRVPDNYARIIETFPMTDTQLKRLLQLMVETNPDVEGACLAFEPYYLNEKEKFNAMYFFRNGNRVEYKNLGNDNYNYFYMDWYQIPRELGKPMWSEPYFDTGGANMLISTYSVPIYLNRDGQRKLAAILTIDLSLDWLQRYVNEIKVYQTGYGFLLSKAGTLITHPIRSVIMNETVFSIADEQKSPQLREIGRSMIRGETSFAEIEYRNVRTGALSWIAYAPITLNGWSLGVVFPVDEFMAEANHLRLVVIGLGFGGGIFLLILIFMIARSITGPLRKLTRATETFASGNFDVALPDIRSKDEIGRLNSSFKSMQQVLAKTINDLRKTSEELRISHDQLEEYNRTLEQKVEERTATLKAAQAQLVQSEKMASLGQLTAGIAHEIKNPLNFVNNFSELSVELTDEVMEELDKVKDQIDPADLDYIKGILNDIGSNVKKINEHGKRADSIIRSMLLHSRGKAGEMQPTDINALLAEYVAIGYHGLRATDNTFNIKIEADYDPDLGKINVVPQDLGRVFLNMINNACYATIQKKKELKDSYFPILTVSTKRVDETVVIRIRDNGKGMSKEILEKIFNPFFTTKPAGSGTGLGLSITYDIVVQEHGGEIKVDSKEGEYAEFTIIIPIKK